MVQWVNILFPSVQTSGDQAAASSSRDTLSFVEHNRMDVKRGKSASHGESTIRASVGMPSARGYGRNMPSPSTLLSAGVLLRFS